MLLITHFALAMFFAGKPITPENSMWLVVVNYRNKPVCVHLVGAIQIFALCYTSFVGPFGPSGNFRGDRINSYWFEIRYIAATQLR